MGSHGGHMRSIALLAGVVWMTGCATATGSTGGRSAGAPLTGQALFESYRYRPTTPAAMPRAIPDESDEAPAVVAEAPKRAAPVSPPPSRERRAEPKRSVQPASGPGVSRDARETVLATAR